MKDAELRSALLQFFQDQNTHGKKFLDMLETALENPDSKDRIYDAVDGQMKFLRRIQKSSKRLMQVLGAEAAAEQTTEKPVEQNAVEPIVAAAEPQVAAPELQPFERDLVAIYNHEQGKWTRTFRPTGFGAENVNEIWEKGGEPKFARKEGGIYNLIEADGTCYVVPEPGLRLQEGYFRSEGLRYLFDVSGNSTEHEPLIALVSPARVEESGGRWNILSKGEIRGRT